jgi:hypothetical protein
MKYELGNNESFQIEKSNGTVIDVVTSLDGIEQLLSQI